jgi:hypothetical protein
MNAHPAKRSKMPQAEKHHVTLPGSISNRCAMAFQANATLLNASFGRWTFFAPAAFVPDPGKLNRARYEKMSHCAWKVVAPGAVAGVGDVTGHSLFKPSPSAQSPWPCRPMRPAQGWRSIVQLRPGGTTGRRGVRLQPATVSLMTPPRTNYGRYHRHIHTTHRPG